MLNYPVKLEKLFLGVFSFNFIMLISGSNIGGDSHLFGVELLQILEQPLLDKGATKSSFLGLFVHVSLQSRKVQLSFSTFIMTAQTEETASLLLPDDLTSIILAFVLPR